MLSLHKRVRQFAFASRIIVILLSCIFNFILPDHNAGVFISPTDHRNLTFADNIVFFLFGGLVRWDAQYFTHISSYGYTYENCLAFFPLYPTLVRFIAGIVNVLLQNVLSQHSIIVVSAVLLNIFCFVWSAQVLFNLGIKVLRNSEVAYVATLLYCINPASIFFTAPYSESLFAYLTFFGMNKCEDNRLLDSGIVFGLAAATRSNGLLNMGFIIHRQLRHITQYVHMRSFGNRTRQFRELIGFLVHTLLRLVFTLLIMLAPFLAFQMYCYYRFCFNSNYSFPDFIINHAKENDFVLPGSNMSVNIHDHWCKATIPFAYSYVQSHYWNVGFLKYYEWKQIPNFLLALPSIFIIVFHSVKFAHCYPQHCYSLGLFPIAPKGDSKKQLQTKNYVQQYPYTMYVYIVHAIFLTIFSFLCIHVQVITRLIASANPVMYWFCAYVLVQRSEKNKSYSTPLASQFSKIVNTKKVDYKMESIQNVSFWRSTSVFTKPSHIKAKLLIGYFILYFLLGTIMFSNFLPWT